MIHVRRSIKNELSNFLLWTLTRCAPAFFFYVAHFSTSITPFCNKRNRLNWYSMNILWQVNLLLRNGTCCSRCSWTTSSCILRSCIRCLLWEPERCRSGDLLWRCSLRLLRAISRYSRSCLFILLILRCSCSISLGGAWGFCSGTLAPSDSNNWSSFSFALCISTFPSAICKRKIRNVPLNCPSRRAFLRETCRYRGPLWLIIKWSSDGLYSEFTVCCLIFR